MRSAQTSPPCDWIQRTSQAEIEGCAARGYQGSQTLHSKRQPPKTQPRQGELNKQETQPKRVLASRRVVGAQVLGT
jgi:hypothetical protein